MAQVGDQLLHPEEGWKRYDDTHPAIKYEGDFRFVIDDSGNFYNNTDHLTDTMGDYLTFYFQGSSLRMIARGHDNRTENSSIYIDDVRYSFSQREKGKTGNSTTGMMLFFDISGLENKKHKVKMVNEDGRRMILDAIDIDEDGMLLHPDEVTSIEDLEIGKRIRCHYSATSNQVGLFSNLGKEVYVDGINDFIPPTSSATPNGCFYYIMVDRDSEGNPILMADRNIQHSISWDKLNSEGISSRSGQEITLTYSGNKVPIMEDYNSPEGVVTDSGNIFVHNGMTYYGWNLFREIHHWITTTLPGWVAYEFEEEKIITKYSLTSPTLESNLDRMAREWEFQAWDEANNRWDILDKVVGEVSWGEIETRDYRVNNNKPYKKYRIYVTRNNGNATHTQVFRMKMEESIKEIKFNYTLRLPTGGTSSSDKDNEWDKYIVESDLNGTITAGDNDVWNWGNVDGTGNSSWTSTTPTGTNSANKVNRGQGAVSNLIGWYNGSPTRVNNWLGFRPVLTIEEIKEDPYVLLARDDKYFHLVNDEWVELVDIPESIEEQRQILKEFGTRATKVEYAYRRGLEFLEDSPTFHIYQPKS